MLKILWGETYRLWMFGLLKVPLIFWLKPKVLLLNKEQAIIMIPLKRRSKNHLNSMYFGALCVGADIAGGIHVMYFLQKELGKVSFVFKDFKAEFLKRPEADVHFSCEDGKAISQAIAQALQTRERINVSVHIKATSPILLGEEPVAMFTLTLSLKAKL